MQSSPRVPGLPPAGERLLELLRRRDEGEVLDFDDFCAQSPELEPELRRLFARYEELARSASPLQARAELASRASRAHAGTVEEEQGARALLSELEASLAQRYELGREVGRGGMGVVLEADERPLGRRVAMKVLQGPGGAGRGTPARSLHPRVLARFLAETRVTGRLDHPGIVPVHELGIGADGAVYYTMPLVRGEELGAVIARARRGDAQWSRERVLDVLLRVCEAVAFAHEKGVVHRDLEPANVMVGPFGETYVLDWGLASSRDGF